MYLNKRFGGLGLLPALGVEIHHALPYHPQSKSIERMFGTLEREWICKLKGWCRSSVKERPNGFAKHLRQLLEKKELLTMDAFVRKFQSEILPAYHQFHKAGSTPNRTETDMEGWQPSFDSMSPLEKYNALEKPYLVTPDWQTLCALKLHHAPDYHIGRQGIRFQNVWYWDDALREYIGSSADIFYHSVEKPFCAFFPYGHCRRKVCLRDFSGTKAALHRRGSGRAAGPHGWEPTAREGAEGGHHEDQPLCRRDPAAGSLSIHGI